MQNPEHLNQQFQVDVHRGTHEDDDDGYESSNNDPTCCEIICSHYCIPLLGCRWGVFWNRFSVGCSQTYTSFQNGCTACTRRVVEEDGWQNKCGVLWGSCLTPNMRQKLSNVCNATNINIVWAGLKNAYNKWPGFSLLGILFVVFFFSYFIFARVRSIGDDEMWTSRVNLTLAFAGVLLMCLSGIISGLCVFCNYEIISIYGSRIDGESYNVHNGNTGIVFENNNNNNQIETNGDEDEDDNVDLYLSIPTSNEGNNTRGTRGIFTNLC